MKIIKERKFPNNVYGGLCNVKTCYIAVSWIVDV